MKAVTTFITLAAVAILATASALAHQQKTAITTVLFNPRTDNIEIMHRFNMHDAEHAVKEIFNKEADILSSVETQQRFADYVSQRFAVAKEDGEVLPLSQVGFEVEGKFFWVYQETKQLENHHTLIVQHNALRDLWPKQTNTVNFEGLGKVKTLTFTDNVELLQVEFKTKH